MFFRVTGLSNDGEPVGAQGVPLTPGRSIAVDRLHEYGTPFFIEANLPIESVKPVSPFRRLMIAQDTGSAIVGPARADLYWGAGDDAGRIAGRIRHPGRFVMLLPRELDMVAAGRQMPLPVPKPKIPGIELKKQDGKGKVNSASAGAIAAGRQKPSPAQKSKIAAIEARKQDGKGKADSASAGAIAAGRQKPSPAQKSKIPAIEARKQDGKGKANSASAGAIAAGRQKPLPAQKSKTPAIEVKKQDGKGKAQFRQHRRDRGRQAEAVAGAKIEDPRDRGQETGRQGQSQFRRLPRGFESGREAGPASRLRAKELPRIVLIVVASGPLDAAAASIILTPRAAMAPGRTLVLPIKRHPWCQATATG